MKQSLKKSFVYGLVVAFAIATAYIIIYAYWHQDKSELIYIIFNSYALVAILLCFAFALYWKRSNRKNLESKARRRIHMVKNLAAPAFLWDDTFTGVIVNDKLVELTEMGHREEGFDPKFLVPWLFGKTDITEADIKEIITEKNKEYSFTAKEGTPHDIIWNTSAFETDEDGSTVFLTIGFDLANIRTMQSEIRSYSKRLAASEGKHALSMELTEIGILLGEQGSSKVFPSPELQKMLGINSNAIDIEDIRKRVYPMDQSAFDQHLEAVRQNMGQFLGEIHVLELRLCGADGMYRWFSYRFKAAKGDNGKLVIGGALIDISKDKEKDAKIEQIAYEDTITKIANRNKLMMMGEEIYQCTVELNSSYWVIVMDIDRFHLINDTCGYENGNELLKTFAATLSRQFNRGGFGARISGDTFALILRNTGDPALPTRTIQKIQHDLASQAVGIFANRTLTCSAGYAQMPRDGENFETVLEHAEFALTSGADTPSSIYEYSPQMREAITRDVELEQQLINAIRAGELTVQYQPKISLADGAMVGMEASVHWIKKDGTEIPQDEFLPIAEKSQLITQITRYALYETCRQASLWQKMGLPAMTVSINLSSADFYQDNLCEQVINALKSYKLDVQYLEIEVTEELILQDAAMATSQIQQLRDAGIQIALDNFGVGYSSLNYLQSMPFHSLNFDRSFIPNISSNSTTQAIVRSVIEIAKAKHIKTTANGVTSQRTASILRELGCDCIQGEYSGTACAANEAEQAIRQNMTTKLDI